MTRAHQNQWLTQHIPHRLSACLAELPLQSELLMLQVADDALRLKIRAACCERAVWEGRMVWRCDGSLISSVLLLIAKGSPAFLRDTVTRTFRLVTS